MSRSQNSNKKSTVQPISPTEEELFHLIYEVPNTPREVYLQVLRKARNLEHQRKRTSSSQSEDQITYQSWINTLKDDRIQPPHGPVAESAKQQLTKIVERLEKLVDKTSPLQAMELAERQLSVGEGNKNNAMAPVSEAARQSLTQTLEALQKVRDAISNSMDIGHDVYEDKDFRSACQKAADLVWDGRPGRLCFLALRCSINVTFTTSREETSSPKSWKVVFNGKGYGISLEKLLKTASYDHIGLDAAYWDITVRCVYIVLKTYSSLCEGLKHYLEPPSEANDDILRSKKLYKRAANEVTAGQGGQIARAAKLLEENDARHLARGLNAIHDRPAAVPLLELVHAELFLREIERKDNRKSSSSSYYGGLISCYLDETPVALKDGADGTKRGTELRTARGASTKPERNGSDDADLWTGPRDKLLEL